MKYVGYMTVNIYMFLSYGPFLSYRNPLVPCCSDKRGFTVVFREKELSHRCSALAFVKLFVAAAAMSTKNLTSSELKVRNSLNFCLTPQIFHALSNA